MTSRNLRVYEHLILSFLRSLGRKPTVILSHLMYFVGGAATLLSQNFYLLVVMRFLVGCAHHTVSHLPFLIGNKVTSKHE